MLGILIDAGILMFLVAAVNDDDQVEFWKAALVGIAMSIAISVVISLLAQAAGLTGVIVGLIPAAAAAGLVAWVFLGMVLQRAMIVGGLFLLAIILRVLLFQWLIS